MFTGIIEEIGTVQAVHRGHKSLALTIRGKQILTDIKVGDSIAVNGICLTVVSFSESVFQADVMNETVERSTLAGLRIGSRVNLESAMQLNGRFGGHIVSGHVDGVGCITAVTKDDNAIWYSIQANDNILRYVIEKGSVAIDGISLTVARVNKKEFSVSVIPHTLSNTTLYQRGEGDFVHIENDCVGKYIEKLLGIGSADNDATDSNITANKSNITLDFLKMNGY